MKNFNVGVSLTTEGREKKINAIKTWRTIFNQGLKDSKDLVEMIGASGHNHVIVKMNEEQLLAFFINNHTQPTQQHFGIREVSEATPTVLDLTR
jgi:hypothetical protein